MAADRGSAVARVRITAGEPGCTLATGAGVADTPLRRMVGLLGRSALPDGDGLVLGRCRCIHTWFMRFPIDVVFVDRRGRIVHLCHRLRPYRLAWGGLAAETTIELPAGTLRAARVAAGSPVRIERT
jgi:uncharacterized membrane protein (UPF0127 family)